MCPTITKCDETEECNLRHCLNYYDLHFACTWHSMTAVSEIKRFSVSLY